MKKIFALLLIIALILCGCNKNVPSDGTDTNTNTDVTSASDAHSSETAGTPDKNCDHKDQNTDGICDLCFGSVLVKLDLFAINDLHGKFCDSDSQPGLDELTTYLNQQYKEKDNVILLSSGDTWQGSSESNVTKGALMTEWMNEMNFASMTLGNHEFDWGENKIAENYKLAEFPFLAINIYNRSTDTLVEYCRPSTIVETNGLKVGIIGAIGDCYSSIEAGKTKDIYFKTGDDLTELVKEESEKLRAEGADIIVYSIHDGWGGNGNSVQNVSDSQISDYYDISLSDGYVDLVFEGHTHKTYILKDSRGVYHLQGGGDNKGISHAALTVNIAADTCTITKAEFISSNSYKDLEDSSLINDLLDKYKEQIGDINKVIGQNDSYRDGNYLRELLAKLYYQVGVERWGDKYDIALGGAYMSIRSPYHLESGDVTYAMIQTLFPFDNDIAICSLKGSSLKNNFFESKNNNYFIFYGEYGESIKNSIDPNKTYYIISDSYSYTYAPNELTVVEKYDDNVFPRDLLADYVKNGGLGSPKNATGFYDKGAINKLSVNDASLAEYASKYMFLYSVKH